MTAGDGTADAPAVDPVLYGAYVAAWAFFAYGPQLVICLLFAWSACKRVRGDRLFWLTRGFLWSLLPFVGVGAMWWIWRDASRRPAGGGAASGPDADGRPARDDPPAQRTAAGAAEGPAAGDAPHDAGTASP